MSSAAGVTSSAADADRIQRYLRAVVEREREPVSAGAFVLYVHPADPHPFLNYAIPAPDATDGDGAELIRAARARGLVPRLEYLESCFPWVEASLDANGFARESHLRLMTCPRDALGEPAAEVDLRRVEPGSALVRPMLTVTRAAFGEGPPDDDEVARWNGNTIAALMDGEVVGSATWTTVIDGMSEIGGVAVAEAARRRGIGAALTVGASRGAFNDGASMVLLTPGDDATARVYERAGFRDATTMLHLRRADPAA
jgi:predicted GNAT family acetyltransferase